MVSTSSIPSLIDQMHTLSSSDLSALPPNQREALLHACASLRNAAETTFEKTARLVFGGHEPAMLRVGIDMGLFDALPSLPSPFHISDLARKINSDAGLVRRIIRTLAPSGLFKETGIDTFEAASVAHAYARPSPVREAIVHLTSLLPILSALPEYFLEKGYENPSDAYSGPFQYARHTPLHYFEWLKTQPQEAHAFNVAMTLKSASRGEEWFSFYPVAEKFSGVGAEGVLIVDVGGGLGHDMVRFKNACLELEGRCVVQDLEDVVKCADVSELPGNIEVISHDFFQVQPVKGARAYYLHSVLHDWPDKQASQILTPIWEAMDEKSVFLVHETILSDTGVTLYQSQLDLLMMAEFAALDRTRGEFEKLLGECGFEVVGIWTPKMMVGGSGILFEARKRVQAWNEE